MSFVLVLACAVLAPVGALLLGRLAMGRHWSLTPLILFLGVATVFVHIGFIVYFVRSAHEPWAWNAVAATSLGIITVGLGGLAGAMIAPDAPARRVSEDRGFSYFTAMSSSLVIFGVVVFYFVKLGYVPLFEGVRHLVRDGFITGLLNTYRINRDVYFNPEATYIPFQGFMEIVRYNALPIVALWFLHFSRVGVHRTVSRLVLASSVLLIVASGQRWPLMNLLIAALVYYSWTEFGLRRHASRALWIGMIGLAAGTVLSALLGRTSAQDLGFLEIILFGWSDLLERIVLGNAEVPFLSYSVFPDAFGWLHGGSWRQNLLAFLPGPAPSFPVTFHQMVTGSGRGFTAPPDFFTEAFINFGFWGVGLMSFVWGVVLSAWSGIVAGTKDRPLGRAIHALIVTMLGYSAMTGASFLIGGAIVVVFVLGLASIFETMRLTLLRRLGTARVTA